MGNGIRSGYAADPSSWPWAAGKTKIWQRVGFSKSRAVGREREDEQEYLLPSDERVGHHKDMGGTIPLYPVLTMTTKQIRELQAFAVELVKEGSHDAAREVLALIKRG